MAEILPEEVSERIEKGWIRARLWFELLAVKKETTESSLKEHVEKIKKHKEIVILKEDFKEIKKVENPMPNVNEAYSQAVEVELITQNIESMLSLVVFYAPSSIEILEPERFNIGMETVQVIMNSVSDLIHRYVAQGTGGVVVNAKK